MKRRFFLSAVAATASISAPHLSWAQAKPTRLVVPFPPGGATDLVARAIAEPLSNELGRTVIVDNRAGAGGSIGMAEVARAAPDGRTLGLATVSTHGVNPVVYKKLPYDAVNDFVPIAEIARAPLVMLVHPSLPAQTMSEFLKYAKRNPGKLTFGSPGTGSLGQMAGEVFKSSTNTFIIHIPYRGAGPMLTDLLSGQVQIGFDQLASAMPYIKQGKLRALAISWDKRLPQLPDVPTFAEVSLFSNNESSWFGIVAPAKTVRAEVNVLNAALRRVLQAPSLQTKLEPLGMYATGTTPDEFADQIRRRIDQMQRVARFARISLD